MAVEIVDGVEHRFAPNPKMQGEDFAKEFPPIVTRSKWLINKFTGEIVPSTEEFLRRSDMLEPYLGELPKDGVVNAELKTVTTELNRFNNETADDGELTEL